MIIEYCDEFENDFSRFLKLNANQRKLILQRTSFVANLLSGYGYNAAIETNYFEICKGSSSIYSLVVKKGGSLNIRVLCAFFDDKKVCAFLTIFNERSKADYASQIALAENRAALWAQKNHYSLWRR